MLKCITLGPMMVNTYIVSLSGKSCFVVDPAGTHMSSDEDKVYDYIKANALVPEAIVLTHGHFDHILGLKHLKEVLPRVPILIHQDDASHIGPDSYDVQSHDLRDMGLEGLIPLMKDLPGADGILKGHCTLKDAMPSLEGLSSEAVDALALWNVVHTPGHTEGSICLYNNEDKTLISGDTMFFHSYGRTDLPGGNEERMLYSLRLLHSRLPNDTKVYPGHDRTGFILGENTTAAY